MIPKMKHIKRHAPRKTKHCQKRLHMAQQLPSPTPFQLSDNPMSSSAQKFIHQEPSRGHSLSGQGTELIALIHQMKNMINMFMTNHELKLRQRKIKMPMQMPKLKEIVRAECK